ncbi:MAG: SDR family oxidoreductase [Candidatus Thorarchaeota archaeon]
MNANDWNIKGKVCLITGSTSGIGKATAITLAKMGARGIITYRNKEKGEAVIEEIKTLTGNNEVEGFFVNFASLKSMKEMVEALKQRCDHLNVLINNVGTISSKRCETEDGIEMNFGVTYLSHFYLTNLLLDVMKASSPARIINVAGMYYSKGSLPIDPETGEFIDLQMREQYNGNKASYRSKLADILFTYELARRLQQSGADITVNCLHPGAVRTGAPLKDPNTPPTLRIMYKLMSVFFKSPEKGAETSVYLATSPEVNGVTGKYFINKKIKETTDITHNRELAEKLWNVSKKLVGFNQ